MKIRIATPLMYLPRPLHTSPRARWLVAWLASVMALVCPSFDASAQVTIYRDEGTFNAATATVQFVEDKFEGLVPPGETKQLARTSFDFDNGPITYSANDSLSGYSGYNVGVASATAYGGQLTLDGSDSLFNTFDRARGIQTVRMDFNRPTTAVGMNFGMTDLYPPDDPRSNYPKTDYIEIQLFAMTDDGEFYPLNDVYYAGYPVKGFIGFVSTVPIVWAEFTHRHPQDYYGQYGYTITDYTSMVFDNVRAGQVPTLPTVTAFGSSPDANVATGQAGDFLLALSGQAATNLTVSYTVGGNAVSGTDYQALSGTVQFDAGQTTKLVSVTPLPRATMGRSVELTVQAGTGYIVGTPGSVRVNLTASHPPFFTGEIALANGVYYLSLPDGDPFGYYSYLPDPRYIYHFDLGYEYVFDAADGKSGVYLYDFASQTFFYTSPLFSFPYLYDFSLNAVLYYYPDPNNPGRYNTNGVRYFYNFSTGQIITK